MTEAYSIGSLLHNGIARLERANIASARLDAELLMAHSLHSPREWVLAHTERVISADQAHEFERLVAARLARTPLVHLTGHREFYGLEFTITGDVLTPRTETEQMVEWAIGYAPPESALVDIGTGSGAIAIAIAKYRPDLAITATDISLPALKVAKRNAVRHDVDLKLTQADLWQSAARSFPAEAIFQTVVTNLPYLRDDSIDELMPEVKQEPALALFGGSDGLDLYRRFLAGTAAHLAAGGFLFTECDPWQQEALILEAAKYRLKPIEQGYFVLGFRLE